MFDYAQMAKKSTLLDLLSLNRNDSVSAFIPPTKKSMTFLQMYLLEEGKLGFSGQDLLRRRENRTFTNIADTMTEIFDDDRDAFFSAVCFFKILSQLHWNDN